jgi:uncharacterized spore protein YtfJ
MARIAKTLRSLGDRLQAGASLRNVFGDPVEHGGRMVIPVARLRYGFGAGGSGKARSGRGGSGAGGGLVIRPVGAIEITESGTRFVPFIDPVRLGTALLIGFLLGLGIGRRSKRS